MKIKFLSLIIIIFGYVYANSIDTVLSYKDYFNIALGQFELGRYKLAENSFKQILIDKKNYTDPASHFMLAKSQYAQNNYILCRRTCNTYLNKYKNSAYELDVRLLISDILIKQEKYNDVLEQLLPLRHTISDSSLFYRFDERILSSIQVGIGSNKIESLLFSTNNPTTRSILNLARSYRSLLDGDINDMELSLSVIDENILPDIYRFLYNRLSFFIGTESGAHGFVAVILPLSGHDQKKGKAFLMGLCSMVEDYKLDLNTHFKIYDNESDDINTIRILKRINTDRSILCVLGYLSEVSNLAATSFSGLMPILLSKSNFSDLPLLSENIYLLSTSAEVQAKLSAQYIINILGYKNIAVLSPADDINKTYATHFISELNQLGIKPVSVEWYYGKPENIKRQFSEIRKAAWGLLPKEDPFIDYLDMDIDSIDALFDVDVTDFINQDDDISNINKMSKKDSLKVTLETIDAIYIPINRDHLSFIGTQLPLYNLETKIVGNESWLDIDILAQEIIGPHLQGLTVLSSEYPKFGINENSLLDRIYSMGYDHSYFINSLIKLSSNSRKKFKRLLKKGDLYMGASSLIELSGLSNNENNIVRVLEYKLNKMETIGYFNGVELVKNQALKN